VEIYSPELRLEGKLGSGDGEFGQPSGIAVDAAGLVYVADSKANLVKVYRPDGTRQSVIGGAAESGATLQFPVAIAVNAASGEIVVTDLGDSLSSRGTYGGARVQAFTPAGAFLRSFGHFGRGDGLLVKPLGVTTDGDGKIYVTDAFQNVVEVFDRGGSYLGTVQDPERPLRTPLGIAFSRSNNCLYVCSLTAGKVEVFDVSPPALALALTVSPAGDGQGTVTSNPAGITCPGVCSALFPAGTAVTLEAAADSWSTFPRAAPASARGPAC
jgi:DNA-binding beta-propeller fold protein YncE